MEDVDYRIILFNPDLEKSLGGTDAAQVGGDTICRNMHLFTKTIRNSTKKFLTYGNNRYEIF